MVSNMVGQTTRSAPLPKKLVPQPPAGKDKEQRLVRGKRDGRVEEGGLLYPVHVEGLEAQGVDDVHVRVRPLAPLEHLGGAEVVRRVDGAGAPMPRHLPQVIG